MITNLREEQQHKHKNGGGWVAETAYVEPSVFVGPYAIVYGQAQLSGKVRILDFAQVSGHAELSGNVIAYGNVWLGDKFKASTGSFHKNERVQTKAERIQ